VSHHTLAEVEQVLDKIRSIVSNREDGDRDRVGMAKQLAEAIRPLGDYRWVGIYDVSPEFVSVIAWSGPGGPAVPTFPVTQGLTGAAIRQRIAIVVGDVKKDQRYLTCLGSTRSEIIVPVLHPEHRRVIGTIDVESDQPDAFSDEDQEILEQCAEAALPLWTSTTAELRAGDQRAQGAASSGTKAGP